MLARSDTEENWLWSCESMFMQRLVLVSNQMGGSPTGCHGILLIHGRCIQRLCDLSRFMRLSNTKKMLERLLFLETFFRVLRSKDVKQNHATQRSNFFLEVYYEKLLAPRITLGLSVFLNMTCGGIGWVGYGIAKYRVTRPCDQRVCLDEQSPVPECA